MPRIVVGDVALHVDVQGTGPPLLLLHGFTSSAGSWRPLLPVLTRRYTALCVDLIGHGRSDAPANPERYAFRACIDDLVGVLDRLDIERCACLGYSMGGRIALGLTLTHPSRIAALTLESASPGLADSAERTARRSADTALAKRIEDDGVEAFVDAWMAQPLFASQARLDPATRAFQREARLRHSAHGLANSLRGMGTGAQPSLWTALPKLAVPVLLVAGAKDEKFRRIATQMREQIPHAELGVIPEAGHTTHLEQPATFLDTVMNFLSLNLGPSARVNLSAGG